MLSVDIVGKYRWFFLLYFFGVIANSPMYLVIFPVWNWKIILWQIPRLLSTSRIRTSGRPPPIRTVTSGATAIYNPPDDGFPFVAAFNPTGKLEASVRSRGAEAFLQAFMQEGAGEYGLYEYGQS
jgi:hypothetical protein